MTVMLESCVLQCLKHDRSFLKHGASKLTVVNLYLKRVSISCVFPFHCLASRIFKRKNVFCVNHLLSSDNDKSDIQDCSLAFNHTFVYSDEWPTAPPSFVR